ncbi:DUF1642 domain-containing protein [Streptococcus oralis]|uniref:DUF1642 domain-containing protein n=1 Tax=Streptococcus oralis TaxID=1303 RepID=UPI0020C8812A|nr:DUF1642 domain-containing protein [Streptococcus oralis]MCP8923134.1 DUF1642 domain-containing protein [Streptococcus oralis]
MDIKALIKKYEELWNEHSPFYEPVPYTSMVELFLKELKQLDEPHKVTIPQCVHKYIQEAKEYNWDLQDLMKSIDDEDSEDLQRWFYHECNQETLARAWLDGYEVEEEKKFFVKIKCLSEEYKYLNYFKSCREWLFSEKEETKEYRTAHTRKELEEAGFGWVFDCPGIEVEEVE